MYTLIRHQRSFRKSSLTRGVWKRRFFIFIFLENTLKFENGAFQKRWHHKNHVIFLNELSSTQIQNDWWLMRFWFLRRSADEMKPPVYFKFHRRSVRLMKTSYLWWLKDIDYKIVNNAKLFSNVKISLILKKIHSWYQQFSNFHTCLLKTQHLTADCSDEKRNLVCKSFAKLLFLATGDNFSPKKAGQMILWKQNSFFYHF